jgi:hypothetical protein
MTKFLTIEQAAKHLGLSVRYLYQMKFYGKGPPVICGHDRRLLYKPADLKRWDAQRIAKKNRTRALRAAKEAAAKARAKAKRQRQLKRAANAKAPRRYAVSAAA